MDMALGSGQAPGAPGRVSIIICTRGRGPDLAKTLGSLANVQLPASLRAELLVVENDTSARAEGLTRAFSHERIGARYLCEATPGKANALNRAIAEARGQILVFTDDDLRFPADWLAQLCEPILAGRADAVAGGVRLAPHLLRPWMNHTHRAWLASTADYLSPDAPSEMCGANMAVSRRVLEQVGGFDPELGPGVTGGGEESLFSWQLQQAGFRLAGAPEAQVEHHLDPGRLTYQNWIKAARLKGRTRAYHLHHWFHEPVRLPRLRQWYLRAKLAVRRTCSHRPRPDEEGIAPWELSYVEDIATCAHYLAERRRPCHYALRGLRKLNRPEALAGTSAARDDRLDPL